MAVEPILGVAPRNSAAEMRALAIRGDDPAWGVKKEEASLAERIGRSFVALKHLEDLLFVPTATGFQSFEPVHANERGDERRNLNGGEASAPRKPALKSGPPPPAQDRVSRCS